MDHRIDSRVSSKLNALACSGIRDVAEMRRHIRQYLTKELFDGQSVPPETDAKYWPSNKAIFNSICRTRQHKR